MRPEPARKAFARGRRLAKAPRDVQQTDGVFPRPSAALARTKKPPGSSGFFILLRSTDGLRLEPLASAATIYARRATPVAIAVHAALKAVLPPMPAAEAAPHMGQDGEPAFLAIVQGLVERVSRVGDPLHRRRRGRHAVGAVAQARHRIVRLLLGP